MSKTWQIVLFTVVIGVAAFFTGPMIWPMSHEVPTPPPNLLPAYIAISAVEALAFGFAVAFAVFGWSAIRDLRLGAPWLNRLLFVTLIWFMGNWWMHDNLHMHIALDAAPTNSAPSLVCPEDTSIYELHYFNFAYSALACFRMGMSGSASFQRVRKSRYFWRALAVSPCMA